ncbi:hypothetical protein L227DRAFT_567294 [Lentinus tigrinus ALCF2SS1-6]|uniref:Uncharacterized protein n=1 Tax=Lentinus tigrinus ALCF2SS1-6 TaxID=1328759 RepID=A0A5C2RST1_9APHY|nr:hypothetical protein L227DRAFT_567294 [Lentinus tigrinus ALCF2SS1-6]
MASGWQFVTCCSPLTMLLHSKKTHKCGLSQTEADNLPNGDEMKCDCTHAIITKGDTVDPVLEAEEPEESNRTDSIQPIHSWNPGYCSGLQIGLNWQDEQCEKDEAACKKAQKKKEKDLQKAMKAHKAEHKTQGIKCIAELEVVCEIEDEADMRLAGSAQHSDSLEGFDSEYNGHEDKKLDLDNEQGSDVVTKPQMNEQCWAQKHINICNQINSAHSRKPSTNPHSTSVTEPCDTFNNAYLKTLLTKSAAMTQAQAATTVPEGNPFSSGSISAHSCDGEDLYNIESLITPIHPLQCTPAALNLDNLHISDHTLPTPLGWDFHGGLSNGESEGMSSSMITIRMQHGHPSKTSQRLIHWHKGFLKHACTVVKEGKKAFSNHHKAEMGKNVTSADIKAWLSRPMVNIKPHSMFMSIYILHTFMPHMATLTKSYLKESKPQLGALGMAAAAPWSVETQ